DHGDLAVGEPYPGTVLAGEQSARVDEGAVLLRLLDELAHRLQQRSGRRGLAVRLGVPDERQILHGASFRVRLGDERAVSGSTRPPTFSAVAACPGECPVGCGS